MDLEQDPYEPTEEELEEIEEVAAALYAPICIEDISEEELQLLAAYEYDEGTIFKQVFA